MVENQPRVIEFKKCPVCGSENRYCESLGNQEKTRGHMRKEINFCLQVIEGICLDKGTEPRLPMGTTLPAYHVTTDICSDCGTIYVTQITEVQVMKQPSIVIPGQKGNFRMPPFPGQSNPQEN